MRQNLSKTNIIQQVSFQLIKQTWIDLFHRLPRLKIAHCGFSCRRRNTIERAQKSLWRGKAKPELYHANEWRVNERKLQKLFVLPKWVAPRIRSRFHLHDTVFLRRFASKTLPRCFWFMFPFAGGILECLLKHLFFIEVTSLLGSSYRENAHLCCCKLRTRRTRQPF